MLLKASSSWEKNRPDGCFWFMIPGWSKLNTHKTYGLLCLAHCNTWSAGDDYSETKILKLRTLISVTLVVNHFDEELKLLPEIEKKSF